MLFVDGLVSVALLGVWVYTVLSVCTSDKTAVRRLPKWAWVLVVVLGMPLLGPALWWWLGRPVGPAAARPTRAGRRPGPDIGVGPDDNRTRAAAAAPDDDAEFLAALRKRAQEQRRNQENPPAGTS